MSLRVRMASVSVPGVWASGLEKADPSQARAARPTGVPAKGCRREREKEFKSSPKTPSASGQSVSPMVADGTDLGGPPETFWEERPLEQRSCSR